MYRLITEPNNEIKKSKNPISKANILEIFTFSWLYSIFKIGRHRDLYENDLYTVLDDHKSSLLGNNLENTWRLEVKNANKVRRNPSLLRALIKMFGSEFMFGGFLLFLNEMVIKIFRPILIGELLEHFSKASLNKADRTGYTYVCICTFALVMCLLMSVFLHHQITTLMFHCSMKTRIACSSVVYRKALSLSHSAFCEVSVGHIINLLSNDVNKFDASVTSLHTIWIGPLQAVLVTYLLWREIGIPSLIGASTFLFFIPIQAMLGKIVAELRLKIVNKTDKRVHLMNEIISGIQFIKMYTWEKSFTKLIEYARKKEINFLKQSSYIKSTLSSFTLIQTRIQLFIIVIAYALIGNPLSSKKVFIVLAYYNLLGTTVILNFGRAIIGIAEWKTSIKRLQNFLLLEEKEFVHTDRSIRANRRNNDEHELTIIKKKTAKNNDIVENNTEQLNDDAIVISKATAKWSHSQSTNTIDNINLAIERGRLTAIIGPVGAGKSSLLQVILRELPLSNGQISVRGIISYASQEPWLFSGSIKQNIIFDSPMDHDRYEQVINVCALKSDFKQYSHGDETIVGERGVILSGGQRARISLARSVYKKADIYLLDDPLSAVDTKVGKHLFEKCIKGFLKDKTCVLITHQTQYLANVDQIVVINNASLSVKGSFQEVLASDIEFVKLLKVSENSAELNIEMENINVDVISSGFDHSSIKNISSSDDKKQVDKVIEKPDEELEISSFVRVQNAVYSSYLSSGGSIFKIFLWILMYSLFQITFTSGDYWISKWVTDEEIVYYNSNNMSIYNRTLITPVIISILTPYLDIRQSYGAIYSVLIIILIILMFISSSMFVSIHTRSSINLHNRMFNSIINATMYFFNTNQSGRILNRFSSDLESVDEILPSIVLEFIRFTLTILGILFLILLANIYLIIPAFFVGILFYHIIKFYLKTSQSIKRLEGTKRSPIISHINESLQGLSTIRAYKAEHILSREFDKYQDLHSSAWFVLIFSNSGFGFWIDNICLLYIGFIIVSFVVIGKFTNGSLVGLAITQTIRLLGMFQLLIRQFAKLEVEITSVERVVEYINSPQEVTLQSYPGKIPPKEWPSSGEIIFQNISLRYSSNGQYVLKDLNFQINPTEKVGIVGRTGAGKSSIVRALLRLALNEGVITVDGLDIHELKLQDLRSKFSIIPQEPVLFSGTMRKNLDPYNEFPDHVLWNALDKVELKVVIENLPNGLNSIISENGSNFSVGQRQLVCLARAIVRDNKILVLDEATANVDTQTDALIQQTIRSIFKNCTVITIAHRLHTVMDSNRLLVIDAGRVVEFDHPHILLKNNDGVLHSMVKETGPDTADFLRSMAAESYKSIQTNKGYSI